MLERYLGQGSLDHFSDVWVEVLPITGMSDRRRICGTRKDGKRVFSVDASVPIDLRDTSSDLYRKSAQVIVERSREFLKANPPCANPTT